MKVIIKEDNLVHQKYILDLLLNVQIILDVTFDIQVENETSEILSINSKETNVINLIDIIDKNNENYTGIDLAENIRSVNRTSYIMFLSSHTEYINEAIDKSTEPIAYISKTDPNIQDKLVSAFKHVFSNSKGSKENTKARFTDENGDTLFLSVDDIYAIRTSPNKQKYICIDAYDKTHHVRGRVVDFENIYPNIVRVNKSTLVNKNKISKILKSSNKKTKILEFGILDNSNIPRCMLSIKYKHNLL